MVARSESMFGCYDSYSYRLWSLANVWSTCHFPALTNGVASKDGDEVSGNSDHFIKCPQCQQGCSTFQTLKEHIELCHPHAVPEEGNTAALPPLSSPPPAAVGTGGPYGCSQCSTSFSSKDQLEKHELLHSPNAQVSCKVCHKTFANVYRLQRHMISHDESAILRKFKCTECEKAFKFKHHLKEHIRIHSGEKPFECGNCGKRFSHSGSYSSHMTSKKCLVMNLKMGRNRTASASNSLLDKSPSSRAPKRPSTSLNNNITTSPNHNSYLPILPKYSEAAAAFFSVMAPRDASYPPPTSTPALHPFYMTPPLHLGAATHPMSPYTMSASLGQLLEQLQTNSPHRAQSTESNDQDNRSTVTITEDDQKATSSSSELVMETDDPDKDDEQQPPGRIPSPESNSGDLEAVKRILETVNATVTKQLLQANMQKLSTDDSVHSDCRSVTSPLSVDERLSQVHCNLCKKLFASHKDLDVHDCETSVRIKSEGLAAKLEDAVHVKTEDVHMMNGNMSGCEDDTDSKHNDKTHDDYEIDNESVTTTDHVSEDGRKVRVRSLIADEQLTILKDHYSMNPRPKREELARIAERIGFPVRVVQVWFQNTRARDRREGRLVQIPYSPIPTATIAFPQSIVPSTTPHIGHRTLPSYTGQASPQYQNHSSEQPLDLSTKKGPLSVTSSPSSSPQRPTSAIAHSDSGEEAVNLSHKSSRSPTPFHQLPYQPYHQSSNGSSDYHRSPSPVHYHPDAFTNGSRLARILAQPAHRLTMAGVSSAMGIVPMERLLQYNSELKSPLLNTASCSPNSERRSWKLEDNEDSGVSQEMYAMDEDMPCPTKRSKVSQLSLKGLNTSLLAANVPEPEIEGQFICEQCDKAFSKQSSLARHKYEHSGQRPHKCDECPKAFKHKHHLTEHKRLHSGEKPFQCSKCLKRFSHSGSYSQHMNHRYSYCKPYRE